MAGPMRRTTPRLSAAARKLAALLPQLRPRAQLFQFLRLTQQVAAAEPGQAVAITTADRLSFQPGDLSADAAVNAFGLTGPSGALPFAFSELVIQRRRLADAALGRFMGIFSARATHLLYRAWAKYRTGIVIEQQGGSGDDSHSRMLAGLCALPAPADGAGEPLLGYAALLARPVRSQAGLAAALGALLDVPVRIDALQPRWLMITPEDRSRLGGGNWQQTFNQLGSDAVLGGRILDCQSAITLVLGPLGRAEFDRFFTDHAYVAGCRRFLGAAVPPTLAVTARLILRKDAVIPAILGAGARLGAGSWLAEAVVRRDRDECTILLQAG